MLFEIYEMYGEHPEKTLPDLAPSPLVYITPSTRALESRPPAHRGTAESFVSSPPLEDGFGEVAASGSLGCENYFAVATELRAEYGF